MMMVNSVILEGITHHGRNRIKEVRLNMLRFNVEWNGKWVVLDKRETIQADPRKGPFLLVTPEWDTEDSRHSRWIHATNDKHFRVIS